MFTPSFVITNKILNNISKIEAAEEVIRHSPLLPLWEKEFREDAIVRSAYHGTHIEGNALQKADAKDILEGRDVVGRPRDIQEIACLPENILLRNEVVQNVVVPKLSRIK